MPKRTITEHLRSGGVIVGDGSYIYTLERRGYVLAGPYTPEVLMTHPAAVKELSKEFALCGANVIQALTFSTTEDKLATNILAHGFNHKELVANAIRIAKEVAAPVDAYVCGGVSSTPTFRRGGKPEDVKNEFRTIVKMSIDNGVDFLIGEFFNHVEEAVLAVEVMSEFDHSLPVAVTMIIGPSGDGEKVSPQECAVRLAKAGADIIGVNCGFDPDVSLKTVGMMKEGLQEAGLDAFLMTQPCGFHCPETEMTQMGFYNLPEFPYALEPRTLTRVDCYDYARKAYNLGVRYIGGCCGFEPIHIRAMAVELEKETGHSIPGHAYSSKWGAESFPKYYSHRGTEHHWRSLVPAAGRPVTSLGCPDSHNFDLE